MTTHRLETQPVTHYAPSGPQWQQPAPWQPPVPPRAPRQWSMLVIGLIVGAALAAGVIFGVRAITGSSSGTIHITGQMQLSGSGAYTSFGPAGDSCMGTSGYNDISQGVQVTITDDSGKTLKTVPLGPGVTNAAGHCDFKFTASVPGGRSSYGIAISHRGTVDFTLAQMLQGPVLTLGS